MKSCLQMVVSLRDRTAVASAQLRGPGGSRTQQQAQAVCLLRVHSMDATENPSRSWGRVPLQS